MAGTVVRVIPKRTLDFTAVSSGTSQAQEIVLAQGIDISNWREVSLMVRTHSVSNLGSGLGNKIEINAYLEGRTSEDPGILFATVIPAATVTIDFNTVAPSYTVSSVGSNIGAMLKIAAKGTRTLSATNIRADVSIDLSLKSA